MAQLKVALEKIWDNNFLQVQYAINKAVPNFRNSLTRVYIKGDGRQSERFSLFKKVFTFSVFALPWIVETFVARQASACLCMQSAILLWQICPSVCPSVCPSHSGIVSTNAHIVKLFPPSSRGMTSFYLSANTDTKFQRGTASAAVGALSTRRWENLRFSTAIAVYVGNGTRQAHI